MNKIQDSFRKRDNGEIIYIGWSFCLLAAGILLLVQENIGSDVLMDGIRVFGLVSGVAMFLAHTFNFRSRFRPSWTLPFSLILILVSGAFLLSIMLKEIATPDVSLPAVLVLLAMVNGALLTSTGLQLRVLCLRRWIPMIVLGAGSVVYSVLIYLNVSGLKDNPFLCAAVFCFLLSLQCLLEGLYNTFSLLIAKKSAT